MKPIIAKGTRDFSPIEVSRRNYLKQILQSSFENFGFEPIETPSFEKLDTLLGNYGEEGDRLIFKILNSGEKLKKADIEAFKSNEIGKFSKSISEKALRYDLTVPFARYVAKHQNEICFPFKRYQIQPVWRADRPQYGRFQEFFQCDADVIGSKSLLLELDLIQLYDDVFTKLGLKSIVIKINHRKILSAIASKIGLENNLIDFTVALDKIDKIGKEGVISELRSKNIINSVILKLEPLLSLEGSNKDKLNVVSNLLEPSKDNSGIKDLKEIFKKISSLALKNVSLDFDITLARGLNYYTGSILEVSSPECKVGAIGGGGRYDDLTDYFGLSDMSGVGISFGFERIYILLNELNLFPDKTHKTTQILFANFGENSEMVCLEQIIKLRKKGIRSELYPNYVKINKQFSFADKKNTPFVILIGSDELESNSFIIKDMKSGDQSSYPMSEIASIISKKNFDLL